MGSLASASMASERRLASSAVLSPSRSADRCSRIAGGACLSAAFALRSSARLAELSFGGPLAEPGREFATFSLPAAAAEPRGVIPPSRGVVAPSLRGMLAMLEKAERACCESGVVLVRTADCRHVRSLAFPSPARFLARVARLESNFATPL